MKKIISFILVLLVSMSASAQIISSSNNQGTEISAVSDIRSSQSSIELEYQATITNGWQIGTNIIYKHILIGGSACFGNKTDFQKDLFRWYGHVGGNYRYFFLDDDLYIEGRILFGYQAGSYKVSLNGNDWDKVKEDGEMYLGISPRLGMNFGKISAVVGYRWDFPEFKINKENYKNGYFTVGLAYLF